MLQFLHGLKCYKASQFETDVFIPVCSSYMTPSCYWQRKIGCTYRHIPLYIACFKNDTFTQIRLLKILYHNVNTCSPIRLVSGFVGAGHNITRGHWFYGAIYFLFLQCFQNPKPIWQTTYTTNYILGMFVLYLMHFAGWIQIKVRKFKNVDILWIVLNLSSTHTYRAR